ncbi:hypothetical protein TNCV_5119021 [Trichonephila clavipes]|nr:hypothetical protein TNCV_5119021 [Trichonephila clavipes]
MLDCEFPLKAWLTSFLIFLFAFLLYRFTVRNFDYWKKRKIPYIRPFPIVGSVIEYVRKPLFEIEQQRHQKLGRIFG